MPCFARGIYPAFSLLCALLLLAACGSASDARPARTATAQPAETPSAVSGLQSTPSVSVQVTRSAASPTARTIPTLTPTATVPAEESETAEAESLARHIDLGDVEAELEELVREVDGTVAVTLASPDGTVLWEHNPHEAMEAASLYKLAIMVEIYREQAEGMLAFDDVVELREAHFSEGPDSYSVDDIGSYADVEGLVTAMITQSSNVAAYALLGLTGSEAVNATMNDLGLEGIEIRWSPRDDVAPAPPPDESDAVPEAPEELDPGVEPEEPEEPLDEPATQEPEAPLDEQDTQEAGGLSGALQPVARWLVGRFERDSDLAWGRSV